MKWKVFLHYINNTQIPNSNTHGSKLVTFRGETQRQSLSPTRGHWNMWRSREEVRVPLQDQEVSVLCLQWMWGEWEQLHHQEALYKEVHEEQKAYVCFKVLPCSRCGTNRLKSGCLCHCTNVCSVVVPLLFRCCFAVVPLQITREWSE